MIAGENLFAGMPVQLIGDELFMMRPDEVIEGIPYGIVEKEYQKGEVVHMLLTKVEHIPIDDENIPDSPYFFKQNPKKKS